MSEDVTTWLVVGSCFGALFLLWALSFLRGRSSQKQILAAVDAGDLEVLKKLISMDKLIDGQRDYTYRQCIEIAHKNKQSHILRFLLESNVFPLSWEERLGNWVFQLRTKNTFCYVVAYIFFKPRHISKGQWDRLEPSFDPLVDIKATDKQRMYSETYRF